mmetsp:Transcript_2031/g.4154  ORF Transcript_2031/g.4154 Transcript_2031/m.4154 type:complete len:88 (-) Transcript_2031:9-272(-)
MRFNVDLKRFYSSNLSAWARKTYVINGMPCGICWISDNQQIRQMLNTTCSSRRLLNAATTCVALLLHISPRCSARVAIFKNERNLKK